MAYENDSYDQGGGNPIISGAWDYTKMAYSWSAMNMLENAPRVGYSLPWTRKVGRTIGRNMGTNWGRHGVYFGGRVKQAGLRAMYEKGGVLGFAGARRAAIGAFGREAAVSAGSKYLISRAAGLLTGPVFWAMMAWDATSAVVGGYRAVSSLVSKYRGLELGGYFPETQGSVTSRQRAVQAITSSQLQARSAIGNEAMLFHR